MEKNTEQAKKKLAGNSTKPFLRWAGGKSLFVDTIIKCFPPKEKIKIYYEPFLGAGAAFFAYSPDKAVLSDLNSQLIKAFECAREYPQLVSCYLKDFKKKHNKSFYYQQRKLYNEENISARQAARFIYLNKACYNGIFRVNLSGEFNVPYGYKKKISIPSIEQLKLLSETLKKARLIACDYSTAVGNAKKGDLVYLDPPYPPLNGTAYFTHYTKERFSDEDQKKVATAAKELSKRGCYVIISNADKRSIRKLYRGWFIRRIRRYRLITCEKKVHRAGELIITNYLNTEKEND